MRTGLEHHELAPFDAANLISRVTDAVLDEVREWQNRPLDAILRRGLLLWFPGERDTSAVPRKVSRLIVSHIRRATMGGISLANTQPFTREFGGRMHVFAHNGNLTGIEARYAAAKHHFRPVGETDSEIAFCILAERLSPLWNAGAIPTLDQRFDIIALFAAELRELGPANFLYADGDALFAHGHRRIQADGTIAPPGLWLLRRECTVDRDGLPHSGAALGGIEAGVTIEGSGEGQAITLPASVPLTSEGWRPLAEGEVIVVKDGRVVDRAADGSMQQGDVVAAI